MTKLLEDAIAHARALPEPEQDRLAEALFSHLTVPNARYGLTAEQADEVRRVQQRLASGETRLATEAEVQATWSKLGL
jgi:hypothetical protein